MKKKIIILVSVLVVISLGVACYFGFRSFKGVTARNKFEKIVEQNKVYIHYKYNFDLSDNDEYTYNIGGHDLVFNLKSKESGYKIDKEEKVSTIAKKYDVFYLKKLDTILIFDVTDFGMGMKFIDKKGINNLSEFKEGIFSIDNLSVDNNTLKFDAIKYSDNYIVVSNKSIFSLCFDDYKTYLNDDYAVEELYEIDLNKEINLDNFKKTPKKTIKELNEEKESVCSNIEDTQILVEE